jgi:hypothetical protein
LHAEPSGVEGLGGDQQDHRVQGRDARCPGS